MMPCRFPATLVVLCLPLAAPAAPCVEPPADPANTYDAPHTYDKLLPNYPAIRIASAALPADVSRVADLTYAQVGTRCLRLDLYLPLSARADGGMPVVVLVHGGGWRAGFRSEFAPMAVRLAQHGYAAVAISYRLSGEAAYPAAIHDTRAAVRWVRGNAGLYHLYPQRIALAGGSAGGQIASLAGVTGHLGQFDPGAAGGAVSSAVQAIVNIDGLSDFTAAAALKYEDDPAKQPSAAGAWFGGRGKERAVGRSLADPLCAGGHAADVVHRQRPAALFRRPRRDGGPHGAGGCGQPDCGLAEHATFVLAVRPMAANGGRRHRGIPEPADAATLRARPEKGSPG